MPVSSKKITACPRCGQELVREQEKAGLTWQCPACGGMFATLPVIRKIIDAAAVNGIWQNARAREAEDSGLDCPSCGGKMSRLRARGGNGTAPILDVCPRCQAVWFDKDEQTSLPQRPPERPAENGPPLPQKAREAIALAKVREIAERAESSAPPSGWQWVPYLLGLPVKKGGPHVERPPLATLGLATAIVAASVLGFYVKDLISSFGFVPESLDFEQTFTLVTSTFLHGDILHLLSNLYFLVLFGILAEDSLGRKRYLSLYFLSGLVGNLLHMAFDPRGETPLIGASGCISGIMVYAALAFPLLKLHLFCRPFLRPVCMSAEVYVVFWFAMQTIGVILQLGGIGDVSAAAHIGGAIVGAAFFFLSPGSTPLRA